MRVELAKRYSPHAASDTMLDALRGKAHYLGQSLPAESVEI